MEENPLLQSQMRPSAGLLLCLPCTEKGRSPGHFAAVLRFLVLSWRKEGALNKVSLYPPQVTSCLLPLTLLQSCSPSSTQPLQ